MLRTFAGRPAVTVDVTMGTTGSLSPLRRGWLQARQKLTLAAHSDAAVITST